jgi:hypothetical protein
MGKAYTPEQRKAIYERICRDIAAGMSMSKICAQDGLPNKQTVFEWLMDDKDFGDQYARAREARADARSDRIDDITQDVKDGKLDPHAARVIIEAEKWQAGKENSKRYGDKLDVSGNLGITLSDDQVQSRVAHLLGKAGAALAARGTGETEETA